jgi:hypothetical protein
VGVAQVIVVSGITPCWTIRLFRQFRGSWKQIYDPSLCKDSSGVTELQLRRFNLCDRRKCDIGSQLQVCNPFKLLLTCQKH